MEKRPSGQEPDQNIRVFLASARGRAAAFGWGLLEATVFFVIPDVILAFAAMFSWRLGILFCCWSILGALIGGSSMYFLGQLYPHFALAVLGHVPGISEKMIASVHHDFSAYGLKAMFIAPWQGIPYKIYAVQAGIAGTDFFSFLIATIPARLERFILALLIAAAVGKICQKSIARHTKQWLWFYALLWTGIYVRYIFLLKERWGG